MLYQLLFVMQAAEEERLKEEQAIREHEEYLKMKEAFSVDEEGVDAQEQEDVSCNLLLFLECLVLYSTSIYVTDLTVFT